jgi:hypothetical protein
MIDHYDFGEIVIDGVKYGYDVIVFDKKVERWVRKESHHVYVDEVKKVLNLEPEVIVIGNGYGGVMKIDEEVKEEIENKNIKLIIQTTKQAVKTFNKLLKEKKKIVGLFHLTC